MDLLPKEYLPIIVGMIFLLGTWFVSAIEED